MRVTGYEMRVNGYEMGNVGKRKAKELKVRGREGEKVGCSED